jgi:hypothetical protein
VAFQVKIDHSPGMRWSWLSMAFGTSGRKDAEECSKILRCRTSTAGDDKGWYPDPRNLFTVEREGKSQELCVITASSQLLVSLFSFLSVLFVCSVFSSCQLVPL